MKLRRFLEVLLLPALIACAVAFARKEEEPPEQPSVPPSLSVNGVRLGMTLSEVRSALGPGFREIDLGGSEEYEYRGEGEYPISIFLELEQLDRESEPVVGSVSGSDLRRGYERLQVGNPPSLNSWYVAFPDYAKEEGRDTWRFDKVKAWYAPHAGSHDAPPEVGLQQDYRAGRPHFLRSNEPVRKPGTLNQVDVEVNGIKLGMTESELKRRLGPPTQSEDSGRELTYGQGEIAVKIRGGHVVSVQGTELVLRGEKLAEAEGETVKVRERLGRVDDTHYFGVGGSPLPCWSNSSGALEITTYQPEGGGEYVGEVYWFDPNELPHLWYTGCGAP